MATIVGQNLEIASIRKSKRAANCSWGILIAILIVFMLLMSYALNGQVIPSEDSPHGVYERPAQFSGSSAGELIPIMTGGVGSSTTLGGGSSLGGGAY